MDHLHSRRPLAVHRADAVQSLARVMESVIQETLDPCAAVMFKIGLALSLVERRSSHFTRQGGRVLQHRQPDASLRCSELESTQRYNYCRKVSRVVF